MADFNFAIRCSISLFLALSLLAIASASESGSVPKHCKVKSFEGSYSYDATAENGPKHWGRIEGEPYGTCGNGRRQSPIDVSESVVYAPHSNGPNPIMGTAQMTVSSGSYNWAVNCAKCATTTYKGKTYKLINLHFHSPSEHTLNGTSFPLEAHMVHKASDGSLAVISTLFRYDKDSYPARVAAAGDRDYGTSTLLRHALRAASAGKDMIPLYSVIDTRKGFCRYVGSLTTPPCTEGVTWFVSQNIMTVSPRQVAEYKLTVGTGHDGNNRPTQPVHGREVTCYIK